MSPHLPEGAIETLFDRLAQAIDAAGPERESLLLARLVLLLAEEIGDPARVLAALDAAQKAIDDGQ